MKALVLKEIGSIDNLNLEEINPPSITSNQVLIRSIAIALNPADWKLAEWKNTNWGLQPILGWDVAGIIEQVGDKVTSFKKGDHVFADAHPSRRGSGAFSEFVAADSALVYKKPDFISWEQAATFPLALGTAAQALYTNLRIPPPSRKLTSQEFILIWGGSSSVGAYAIQLAALSGLRVITTCSPSNAQYVKNLGATHVIDRSAPDAIQQIKKIAPHLKYAIDCVSPDTANKCLASLESGTLATVAGPGDPTDPIPPNVTHHTTWITQLDDSIIRDILDPLVKSRQVIPNVVELLPGGLGGIPMGLKRLKEGKVSGKKLVVKLSG